MIHWSYLEKKYVIDWEQVSLYLIVLFMVSLLIVCIIYVILDAGLQAQCLKLGFPEYELTWNFTKYCVRTIEQTQYVVPLENLIK